MWSFGARWLHDMFRMVWDGMPMGIVRSWGPSWGYFVFVFSLHSIMASQSIERGGRWCSS